MKRKNITSLLVALAAILLLNFFARYYYFRIDLTSDERYTVAEVSKKIIKNLDDIVFIRIYLDGEMPVTMKKFQQSVREKLEELSNYSDSNLQFEFRNPAEGSEAERDAVYSELSKKGLIPLIVQENDIQGGTTQRLIFPGVIVNYKGKEFIINLVQDNPLYSVEENLNFAQQNLEYNFVSVIEQISRDKKPLVAFIEGHDELGDYDLGDIMLELANYYAVERVTLNGNIGILDDFKAAVIAKPMQKWSEEDKLVIDQYIMNGGRTAWFLDAVYIHEDSLSRGDMTLGLVCEHNLNDQLFRYGVRINANVIQDLQCAVWPVNFAPQGMPPDFRPVHWPYFSLLIPPGDNPVTKGLNLIRSQYPGVIDTVGLGNNVKKTFLLNSSDRSKITNAPLLISLRQIEDGYSQMGFNQSYLPVAALLEGIFESPFRNRMLSQYNHGQAFDFKSQSQETKMIIVSDGDIIRNDVVRRGSRVIPYPLGVDKYTGQVYGNKEFVKNIINYLADENDLMQIRNYDYMLRLLDKSKVAGNHTLIILVNTILPVMLVLLSAIVFLWWRKRRYAR
ncbi:MAG: gliding motility-associated ABC transporter substrate-binding protein GldG [Prevotellaceae bacterium]|nr:gliding motility-associated ABC transporter substrate-binding protein GldG [Prevotellaceae bacterium]